MIVDGWVEKLTKLLRLDTLLESLHGYVENKMELFKLEVREDVARIISRALVYLALSLFGFLFLVFSSIGLAHFINRYFSEEFAGYWIVAGSYALAFLIFLVFRKPLEGLFERNFLDAIKRKPK